MTTSDNPYESPAAISKTLPDARPHNLVSSFAFRVAAYAITGTAIAAAFCTPLNLARDLFWSIPTGPELPMLACVLASTTITGIALDFLIRSGRNCVAVGFVWAMANAMAFTFLLLVVPGFVNDGPRLSAIPWALLGAVVFGAYGGVLCLHLSLPISAVGIWIVQQPPRAASLPI